MRYIKMMNIRTVSLVFIMLFVFLLDQISKWWIMHVLLLGHRSRAMNINQDMNINSGVIDFLSWLVRSDLMADGERFVAPAVFVLPFFNIVMVWNEGISFGLFSSESQMGTYGLIGMSLCIVVMLCVWLFTVRERSVAVAVAVVIGGALGNVYDRIRFGAVADFFDFHVAGWHYPAFNIADCSIVLGVAYILLHGVFMVKKDTNRISL